MGWEEGEDVQDELGELERRHRDLLGGKMSGG